MPVHVLSQQLRKNRKIIVQMSAFSTATGIPLKLLDSKGRELWSSDLHKRSAFFCRLLHPHGNGTKKCKTAHKKAGKESARWGEAMIGQCCHFIMQITAPVMYDGKMAGYLVASPFLLIDPSELQTEEISFIPRSGGKAMRLKKALSAIPIVKDAEANRAAQILFQLADRLSHPDLGCLLKVREIQELQGKIADEIRDLKTLDRELNPSSLIKLSYEQEKEIIAKIRLGDRVGAKEILYRLLAILLTQYIENFDLLKISILELIMILTRAAVEAGTKIEEVLGIRYRFITELSSIKDQENLCIWVVQLLEKLMDGIYETRHAKNYQRLKEALDFIDANWGNALTVEQIAKEVCLSPSRLSHIIKSELGTTLGNYISKVRIDRAKILLEGRELSISQIALEVGFPDQSYFTKVFKKVERCTPKIFRQNLSLVPSVLSR
jgi:two-component system response regulator YesN